MLLILLTNTTVKLVSLKIVPVVVFAEDASSVEPEIGPMSPVSSVGRVPNS